MALDLSTAFGKHEDEYLKFERIASPLSQRPDLHAFLLLEKLDPGTIDIVSAAEDDEIWLATDCTALAKVITDEQVRDLVRCGIMFSDEYDALHLFV